MSLHLVCGCGARFTVKARLAGKVVKCPNCDQRTRLPPPAPNPDSVPPQSVPPQSASSHGGAQQVPHSAAIEKPSSTLVTLGVIMMVLGALNVFLSLYTSFQVSGASQMIPIPDSLGGGYFRGVARHAEQLNHFGTILCVIFGGIQFAGGLCAINARYWPVSLGGSILLLIPCIGSAFPCFIVFTLPLGIFCLVRLTAEQNVFR